MESAKKLPIDNEADSAEGKITLALAGNPNVGKTSLFNNLTGARQHVGNWPGVTVEKKEGYLKFKNQEIKVVDLPGTYSLGAYSEDEAIARDYILFEKPDVVINVVDATNLERNLYLTTQLLEMGANVVVALNIYDEAQERQIEIDVAKLSKLLNVPIIPTVAKRNQGTKELIACAMAAAASTDREGLKIDYGRVIEEELEKIEQSIKQNPLLAAKISPRWLAVKTFEADDEFHEKLKDFPDIDKILKQRDEILQKIEESVGYDMESYIADRRYGYIHGLIKEVVKRKTTVEERLSTSDKIDRIVTNKYLGIPIFFAAMWMVFQFTFKLGDPMIGWVEVLFGWLGSTVTGVMERAGVSELIISLVSDGIIGGLGSVLVFIPPIFLLFFAISLLEDSGYMARAAYVMDRMMNVLGLHGKSFIPLLIGFGCNVPGIMAARTLDNKKDRLITVLISPFMSCAARLPVYVLFVGAFFSARQGLVIFSLYLLGIIVAVVVGMLFKKFLFKGEESYFVMELPPYRIPTLKSVLIHVWDRGFSFIKKAGTVIFGVVILIWALSNLPIGVEYASQDSLIGKLGGFIAPVFEPAGFGNWQAAVALAFGVLAKEVVVGTMGVVYGVEEANLTQAIQQTFTPLSAYAFMVMTLIYIPCVAALGAIKRETNSWKWTAFAAVYTTVLGWLLAVIVYQGGKLFGLG